MFETMDVAHGVGLAAPQIGVPCGSSPGSWPTTTASPRGVVVNPYLVAARPPAGDPDPHDHAEGCLSVPGESFPLRRGGRAPPSPGRRSTASRSTTTPPDGSPACIQHEYDHLNGYLYVDRLAGRWAKKAKKAVKANGWGVPGLSWMPGVDRDPFGHDDPDEAEARPRRASSSDGRARLGPTPRVRAPRGATRPSSPSSARPRAASPTSALRLAEAPRRRGRRRRRHAALPGHGHRHREAHGGRAARHPAPPARRPRRDRGGERRGLPARGPGRHRGHPRAGARHPVLVGGSGLYVRAALDRLDIPPTDPAVRARWERGGGGRGAPRSSHAVLRARDPSAAARIEPSNRRRIVRALEVVELTGRRSPPRCPSGEYVAPDPRHRAGAAPPRPRRAHRRPGGPDVGARAARRGPRPGAAAVCARAARRAGPSATPRPSPSSTGVLDRGRGVASPRRRRPAGSPAARSRGSAPTRG